MKKPTRFYVSVTRQIHFMTVFVMIINLTGVFHDPHRSDMMSIVISFGLFFFAYVFNKLVSRNFCINETGIYQIEGFKQRFVMWEHIQAVRVFSQRKNNLLNREVNAIEIIKKDNQTWYIDEDSVNNFSHLVAILQQKFGNNDLEKLKIPTIQHEKRYLNISQKLIYINLFLWVILFPTFLLRDYVHISYFSNDYFLWLIGIVIVMYIILMFITSKSIYSTFIQNIGFLSLIWLFLCGINSSNVLGLYHEWQIKNQKLPVTTIEARLKINKDNYQNWQLLNDDKTSMILDDWYGINQTLVAERTNGQNSHVKMVYQLPVYQGNFGFYIITPEQFQQATLVKQEK